MLIVCVFVCFYGHVGVAGPPLSPLTQRMLSVCVCVGVCVSMSRITKRTYPHTHPHTQHPPTGVNPAGCPPVVTFKKNMMMCLCFYMGIWVYVCDNGGASSRADSGGGELSVWVHTFGFKVIMGGLPAGLTQVGGC